MIHNSKWLPGNKLSNNVQYFSGLTSNSRKKKRNVTKFMTQPNRCNAALYSNVIAAKRMESFDTLSGCDEFHIDSMIRQNYP